MKNSSEAKFFPNSNHTRLLALNQAKMLNDALATNDVLTTRTKARLNAIQPLYEASHNEFNNKKAEYSLLVTQKEKRKEETAMLCAHFLQVFNFCVKRGEYERSYRPLYGMRIEHEQLPPLKREWEIDQAAATIIKGEETRVAQGGVPMSNPSAAQVEAKYTLYKSLMGQASNAHSALMLAQKAVKGLNKEATGVIKKVWDEVETFYDERSRENMRKNAREWGVIYARKGNLLRVNGVVTDSATGLPLAGVKVQFANGRNKVITNPEGKFIIGTTLMHEQPLTATLKGYETGEVMVTLSDKMVACSVEMVKSL